MADKPNPEQERLMKLRERQLSTRDPHIKNRKFNEFAADRERRRDKSLSLAQMWAVIPHIWRGGLFGLVAGGILLAVLPRYWVSPWALPCAGAALLILMVLGIVIGRAFDLRDSIKKQL